MACGHACREWHAILDMATIRYAGPSLFEAFCQSLPSRLNVLVNGPSTVRLDNGPWRRVPFLGPGAYRQPWLAYRAAPIYWSFDRGEGNYRYYERFGALVADSGMQALMEWFFYEVVSQPQWQRSGMELMNGHCWSKCPRPIASLLVPASHTFITRLVRRIERERAPQPPGNVWDRAVPAPVFAAQEDTDDDD